MNSILEGVSDRVLLLPKGTESSLNNMFSKLDKILKKRYKIKKNVYRGKALQKNINRALGLRLNANGGRKGQIIAKIKQDLNRMVPSSVKLSNLKALDKLADTIDEFTGEIEFRYALVEKHLMPKADTKFNIKDLHKLDGLKKGEKENIKEFQKTIGKTSLIGREIANAYIDYTNDKLGLHAVKSRDW